MSEGLPGQNSCVVHCQSCFAFLTTVCDSNVHISSLEGKRRECLYAVVHFSLRESFLFGNLLIVCLLFVACSLFGFGDRRLMHVWIKRSLTSDCSTYK